MLRDRHLDDSDSETEEPRCASRGGRPLGSSQTARARLVPESEELGLNFVATGVPLPTGTLVDTRVVNAVSVPAGEALRRSGTASIAIPLGPWATLGVHASANSEQAGMSSLLPAGMHSDEWVAEGDEEERRIKELADLRAAHRARTAASRHYAARYEALQRLLCVIALVGGIALAIHGLDAWDEAMTRCGSGFGGGLELRPGSLFVSPRPGELRFSVVSHDGSNDDG